MGNWLALLERPKVTLETFIRDFFHKHKPRYHGAIQRHTDDVYIRSLDKMGNVPLSDHERADVLKQSKHLRQTQRGLCNKRAANKGNIERGQRRLERVQELDAGLSQRGAPIRGRAARIAVIMNRETPEQPVTERYINKLLSKIKPELSDSQK